MITELENTLLEVPLNDLQRCIDFHDKQKSLGLESQGSAATGAAWSSGDFLITARATSPATTRLRVQSVSGEMTPFGVRSWARLRDELENDGIKVSRSRAERISELLVAQGIQERIASQPLDASEADKYLSRTRAERPELGEDDLQDLWMQHVADVERARRNLQKREQSARDAVSSAVTKFFSSLRADPPASLEPDVSDLPSDPRMPTKPLVVRQWKQIWRTIKPKVEYGYNYKELSEWLHKTHPTVARGPDTLRKIIKAGEAGLLDA